MQTEIEVKFLSINVDELRNKLLHVWAINTKERTLYRRIVYNDPLGNKSAFLRLRDEWDQVTMTYKKVVDVNKLDWVLESEILVSNFEEAKNILYQLWIEQKAYQETYRETRTIWTTVIWIDEWPWLQPFIEIEWESEDEVIHISNTLGFHFEDGVFGSVSEIYGIELWFTGDQINTISEITFKNPPCR